MRGRRTLFLFAVIASFVAFSAQAQEKTALPTIPVVKTYKELLDQPIVRVGDFEVRVGIESNECSMNEGVQLYVWTRGKFNPTDWSDQDVGPLRVRFDKAQVLIDRAKIFTRIAEHDEERDTNLFIKPLILKMAGETLVKLVSPNDVLVAQLSLTVAEKPAQPWVPIRLSGTGMLHANEIIIANTVGIAWPTQSGILPLRIPENLNQSLPRSIPAEPDKDFRLSMEGMDLRIESDREFFTRPDTNMLARWWVNGEPYMSAPSSGHGMSQSTRQSPHSKNVLLHLNLDAAALNAKSGDKVMLQLLYCGSGWEHADMQQQMAIPLFQLESDEKPDVRLTNHVEFVVP